MSFASLLLSGLLPILAVRAALPPTEIDVYGELVAPPGGSLPATVEVRFGEEAVACPVRDGVWRCSIPATVRDFKVEVASYAPRYVWQVTPSPEGGIDLGAWTLTPGASLAGWVLAPDGKPLTDELEVSLRPETVGVTIERFPEEQRRLLEAGRTTTDARGFFQLTGLAEGSYRLRVEGAAGWSPLEMQPVEVAEAVETILAEPLVLAPLASLEVTVEPPLDPAGQPWRLELGRRLPLTSELRTVFDGRLEGGHGEVTGLERASYQLTLLDSQDSYYASQIIELTGGLAEVELELPLVPVVGTLRAGDTPLAATVHFLGLDGRDVRMEADSEGRFRGVLPEEGWWRVKLVPPGGRGRHSIDDVEVVRLDGEPAAVVALVLPDTRLSGRVLDADEEPVTEALVTVYRGERPEAQAWVDGEGRFEVVGLEPGELRLRAEARGGGDTGFVEHELREGEGRDLELVLAEGRRVRFRVTASLRPVAGALVRFFAVGQPYAMEAFTSPLGTFELDVPPGVEALDLVILAPGHPTRLTRVPLPEPGSPPVDLALAPVGGELQVPLRQELVFHHHDRFFPLHLFLLPFSPETGLRGWDPSRRRLALSMEPGEYTICPAPETNRDCASGYLAPGGLLPLEPRLKERHSRRPRSDRTVL